MLRLLGDPHLGKRFIHGVPLHRRGEREQRQFARFRAHLQEVAPGDVHVCLGDLFDRAVVPYAVILETARLYRAAAEAHPDVTYVVIAGNHDLSRDRDRRSAFEILQAILDGVANILVLTEPRELATADGGFVFYPYDPFRNAAEVVRDFALTGSPAVALGHWETETFGGPDHSLIPLAELAALGIRRAITGHVHLPGAFERDGVHVVMPGSMEPFSHAEDPDEVLYVTRSLDAVLADPEAWRDHCLRVRLGPGERLEEAIDCLQLSVQSVGETADQTDSRVELGDFDLLRLFDEAFDDAGVGPPVRDRIMARYHDLRGETESHA